MKFLYIIILVLAVYAQAQIGTKKSFNLAKTGADVPQTFLGNGIVDILVKGNTVWIGTGYGLNKTTNQGATWTTYNSADYLSKGGITAMGYMDENTFWIATAFDTSASGEDLPAGGGFSFTRDEGETWTHINQPVDSRDETEYSPTTTTVQNLTFDMAFFDSTIWITSFGGGLRRSDDMGQSWQVVTTDGQPFSSLENLNHRAFSITRENGNLWYGSAEGISKSADNGQTWQRFTHQNQENPISGNFVVSLAYQEATSTLWAATVEATEQGEVRGVSKTTNSGETWDVTLEGVFAHNFGFDGNKVYVAADLGLFVSDDAGENWYELPPVVDSQTGEEILDIEYLTAGLQDVGGLSRLWLGSGDGLVSTIDNGNTWQVFRSFVSTRERRKPAVYAYPSPFSPSRSGYTRFQYDIKTTTDVEIKIYNFAMEHVVTINDTENNYSPSMADRSTKWDGSDKNGRTVASGVYLFRAKIGSRVTWGKVVVIN